MERTLIAVAVVLAVAVVAYLLGRRRSEAPTQPTNPDWPVPAQLDREDFDGVDRPWLVALFTSSTCNSCAAMAAKAAALDTPQVAVQEISFQQRRDLHDRYGIEAVPCLAVADAEGVVRRGFIGSVTAIDLWSAVAEAREPGSTPEPHLGQHRSLSRPAGPAGPEGERGADSTEADSRDTDPTGTDPTGTVPGATADPGSTDSDNTDPAPTTR